MRLQAPSSLDSKGGDIAETEPVLSSVEQRLTAEGDVNCNGTHKGESGPEKEANNLLDPSKPRDEKVTHDNTCPVLLTYNDAPSYLKFNPYIRTGYRGCLSTKMCLESIFWWTNETINIWSHIFGWMLFLGLSFYDLVLLNIHAPVLDKLIVGLLLACFQACMILSSLYHTFSCRSEKDYICFLSFDLFGIALSLLAIYMSGVYYAFWCYPDWQQFYLITVCVIFAFAMALQVPRFNVSANMKLLVFVGWAAYGVLPTIHWTIMMGGWENPIVELLLPRVLGMYAISGLAFFIYISKIPERWFSGKVDYLGSSHQWWHFFVVVALYYWHNTVYMAVPRLETIHGPVIGDIMIPIQMAVQLCYSPDVNNGDIPS
ncbi:progestin and adipoQ receptor family member 3 isoform X2 [Ischnura elegans]|uniref:progestin and adipoQ receptor family member 3 isoform X2 n=1 Tax=Ischnura elegans TaxID=197161 RepID=UPI001ED88B8D|nr:progestin and adipoQ receptor family member 3 isoform X2 [Ischnura elegans]XP_046393174.1 progestin and adipoQ receptor family member 3 isoform X2 [Ischnura elegans]XP_046393175.1 progestin and adipoQ receptor family member 3 isoform X2 [Ischnura elegans]